MNISKNSYALTGGGILLLALAACGGGGGGGSSDNRPQSPGVSLASAAASVEGLLAYMKVLVASPSDATEPIDITAFVPPTSDTTEPDPSI